MPGSPLLVPLVAGMAFALVALPASGAESLLPYRDRIEQGYNARDNQVIEAAITDLKRAGKSSDQIDLATYYAAFARLRQSAIPDTDKRRARDYLEQCIGELEPLLERHSDYAQARALYASCLGASSNYYVLRAATRGIAAGREMTAALKLAPDSPWVRVSGCRQRLLDTGHLRRQQGARARQAPARGATLRGFPSRRLNGARLR